MSCRNNLIPREERVKEAGKEVKVIGKVGGSSARKKWHDQSILIEVQTALQNKFHFDF